MVLHPDVVPDMDPETRSGPGADPDLVTEEIPEDQEIDFVTLGMFIIGMSSFPCS